MAYKKILQFHLNHDFDSWIVRRCGTHRHLLLSNLEKLDMDHNVYRDGAVRSG